MSQVKWQNIAGKKKCLRVFVFKRSSFLLFFFPFKKYNNFIYFWLGWVFIAACRLYSSCCEQGHSVVVLQLLIAVASVVADHRL